MGLSIAVEDYQICASCPRLWPKELLSRHGSCGKCLNSGLHRDLARCVVCDIAREKTDMVHLETGVCDFCPEPSKEAAEYAIHGMGSGIDYEEYYQDEDFWVLTTST